MDWIITPQPLEVVPDHILVKEMGLPGIDRLKG